MEALIIPEGTNTIEVILDKEKNHFEMQGRSFPEHSVNFFKPVIEWLENYKLDPLPKTKIDLNFVYFNTSSAKLILEIIRLLDEIHQTGSELEIVWHYMEGDEDMLDAGEEYDSMVKIPFTFRSFLEEDYD